MLYEFKSKATGSVVMMQPVAERLLRIIGKEPGPTGIILPEQMPAAIAALQAAVEAERRQAAEQAKPPAEDEEGEGEAREGPRAITLAQRAWPLIDMLKAATAAEKPITWGV